ncbi:MAG: sugar kinase [Pseudonocardiales bacterium]
MSDLVTMGETMALFRATSAGPLRHATSLSVGMAGAESNVAIGLRRLGASTAWGGRVGDDEFGELVLSRLRGEDVDVAGAVVDSGAPTGLMFREQRSADLFRVHYYRKGSAGSRLCPDDVDPEAIAAARVLHVTGITPALSDTARAAVEHAVSVAREAGTLVSLDFNHRSALWSPVAAGAVLRRLTAEADIVFAGDDEAEMVVGAGDPEVAARALAALGPSHVVIKLGSRGAVALAEGRLEQSAAIQVRAVDPVGAGDAFVAGYLAGVLDGAPAAECLRLGCLAGAFAVTVPGDWEGLPSRAELDLLDRPHGTVLR